VKIHPIFIALLVSVASAQTPPTPPSATPNSNANTAPPIRFEPLDPNRVIATIGTETITASQFEAIINGLPAQYQAQARGPMKRQFMEQLVQVKVLAHQAAVLKLDQSPEAKQQISLATENILANLAGRTMVQLAQVNRDDMQKYYDGHKSEFETVSAHHILIRFKGSPVPLKDGQKDLTQEEALAKAQEIVKQLKAGADFEKIAKEESADAGSGTKGGDLGSFKHGQMVKPFEDAAFSMKVGEISDPVKSQFGYHIIRVDKIEATSFDDARATIEGKLKPQIAQQQIAELQKQANVKLDDAYFGPPPAASPGLASLPQAPK
jgi:peptidyl-prolyl cis-trans isomerase C